MIAPHLPNYPIFPVYLYESDSGISNEYTQSCIDDIIKVMGETPYKIKYCSVDGDQGYTSRFTKHFDLIFQSIMEDDDEKARYQLITYQSFEHYIDNRFSTVLHNLARYQLITYQSFEHYIVFNKRHQNPGGVQTRLDRYFFDEEIIPKNIVKELLALIKLEKSEDEKMVFNFVTKLNEFTQKNPLKKLKIPQRNSNRIVD